MTINTFVSKGDLNGKIVVVRFFFCQVYIQWTIPSILYQTRGKNLLVYKGFINCFVVYFSLILDQLAQLLYHLLLEEVSMIIPFPVHFIFMAVSEDFSAPCRRTTRDGETVYPPHQRDQILRGWACPVLVHLDTVRI